MKILHIDRSVRDERSVSKELSGLTELTDEMIQEHAESKLLGDRMINANIYVIGMPIYNFSVPFNCKNDLR